MKVLGVYLDRCLGCKTCELYCAVERGGDKKTLFGAVQEIPRPRPRLRVEGSAKVSFPLQCRHCLQAPCLDACLAGAMVRDATSNLVVLREDLCIGCWTCTVFCPYGVIFPWPERKAALKCDLCLHREERVCVDVCPTKAIRLVHVEDLDELAEEKRGINLSTLRGLAIYGDNSSEKR
jgi:anaerobic carbon-monoxide dehydrogenase iron sulfur subunit